MLKITGILFLSELFTLAATAADLVPAKQIELELAQGIAIKSIEDCRKSGYNVSAVVLDRAGNVQVALRDSLAVPHTLEIAERKAA